jgi:hypothetical protein
MNKVRKQKNDKYHGNITKRGKVEFPKKEQKLGVGPMVIALLVFIVVGSALLQIFRGQP